MLLTLAFNRAFSFSIWIKYYFHIIHENDWLHRYDGKSGRAIGGAQNRENKDNHWWIIQCVCFFSRKANCFEMYFVFHRNNNAVIYQWIMLPHTPCLFNYQALFKLISLLYYYLVFFRIHWTSMGLLLCVLYGIMFAKVKTNVFFSSKNALGEIRSDSIRMKIREKVNSPLRYLKIFAWIFIERWLRMNRSYSDLRLNWRHRCHQHIFADTFPIQRLCLCRSISFWVISYFRSLMRLHYPSKCCLLHQVCAPVYVCVSVGNFPFFRMHNSVNRGQHEAFAAFELNPVWVKVWVKAHPLWNAKSQLSGNASDVMPFSWFKWTTASFHSTQSN